MNAKGGSPLIITVSLTALLISALLFTGCSGAGTKFPAPTQAPASPAITAAAKTPAAAELTTAAPITAGVRQTIRISGSTTVLPIVQKAADQYMTSHANADILVSGGGSGAGILATGTRTADIGMSSREVTTDEMKKYPSFVVTPVARDGIAMIVSRANTIENITLEQIRNIYLGRTTKWTEIAGAGVPGTSQQIVVVGRDSASGTRIYFDESLLSKQTPTKQMLEKNSNGAVLQTVAQTPGAIGYVSIGFVSGDVKALPVWYNADRVVAPSLGNVKGKTYPVSRNLYVITNGQPSGLAGDFIRFLLSPEGQKIVADEGYVTI